MGILKKVQKGHGWVPQIRIFALPGRRIRKENGKEKMFKKKITSGYVGRGRAGQPQAQLKVGAVQDTLVSIHAFPFVYTSSGVF